MRRHAIPALPTVVSVTALLALVAAVGVAGRAVAGSDDAGGGEPVFVELRVWQHVDEWQELWVSARPRGGSWHTLGTVPLAFGRQTDPFVIEERCRYADVEVGGVGFRVWRQWGVGPPLPPGVEEPRSVHIEACPSLCEPLPQVRLPAWGPLGMTPLALDDGHSRSGRYRYGDLTVAIPKENPGLLADREHLLAVRDVLEGDGSQLDWSVATAVEDWEGVTVAGSPLRVRGLDLRDRGLAGEIWGWLGDLAALTELRLNGNALTGALPSKLSLLGELAGVYLGGNDLEGCIPPPLRRAADHDLDALGLPDCAFPEWGWDLTLRVTPTPSADAGTYWLNVFFDSPPRSSCSTFP